MDHIGNKGSCRMEHNDRILWEGRPRFPMFKGTCPLGMDDHYRSWSLSKSTIPSSDTRHRWHQSSSSHPRYCRQYHHVLFRRRTLHVWIRRKRTYLPCVYGARLSTLYDRSWWLALLHVLFKLRGTSDSLWRVRLTSSWLYSSTSSSEEPSS